MRITKWSVLFFILAVFIFGLNQTGAKVSSQSAFYVAFTGNDANPGTKALPWKTLKPVNDHIFSPGDIVHFARGSSFRGGFIISSSGEPGKPITFTDYGTAAAAPRFANSDFSTLNGNVIQIRGSYIVIDGLYFHDCATPPTGFGVQSFFSAFRRRGGGILQTLGAVFIAEGADHNIVRHCEMTRTPIGIKVYGQHNLITRNYIHDSNMLVAPNQAPIGIAVCISNNEVSYNRIVNLHASSNGYRNDGGAIELDDRRYPKDNVSIHHNYSLNNERFLELVKGSVSCKNLVVSYNISDDRQAFVRLSSTGLLNCKLENNTIIFVRTRNSAGTQPAPIDFSWLGGGAPSMLSYRNNIFYLGANYQVSPQADFPHDHNLYYRTDEVTSASVILGSNASLGKGGKIGNPKFIDIDREYALNPGNFNDLRLRNNSPAIDAGANLRYTKDHDDNLVPTGSAPDIGAYEQGVLMMAKKRPKWLRVASQPENWKEPKSKKPAEEAAKSGMFYVNSVHGSDSNPGTKALPWKTLKPVNDHSFAPGDAVYFARRSSFSGGLLISSTGTAAKPITFTSYGRGPAPRFTNPDFSILNGNAIQIRGSYIVIDDLYFHDCATAPPGTSRRSQIVGAVFITPEAHHNIVKNCEITMSPMCIHIYGQYNLITHNYIHDVFFDIPGWWSVGIMICNSNNEISYNLITNCFSPNERWGGGDGGAMEIDDKEYPKVNIYIHHNRSYGNQGFLETVGVAESVEDNIVVSYNVSDDYQWFIGCGNCTNFRVENNTVIRVLNNGSWNGVFRCGRPDAAASFRNNIFVVANGCKVFEGRDNGIEPQKHDHNLYFSLDKIPAEEPQGRGVLLGQGEMITDPLFVDFKNRDLHLKAGSPAIDTGINHGYTLDFDNNPVPVGARPDIGAYEYYTK